MTRLDKNRITRRDFIKGMGSVMGAGLLHAVLPKQSAQASFVFVKGDPKVPFISLTYDDCYDLEVLTGLANLLDADPRVKVSFFPTGNALLSTHQQDPQLWRRIANGGHDIGYHTFNHTNPQTMTHDQMTRDYNNWLEVLTEVLGKKPKVKFARPPYGALSPSFLALSAKYNLVTAWWSVLWGESIDVVQPKIEASTPGDIVLFHMLNNDLQNTIEAVPQLKSKGLQMVSLTRMYRAYTQQEGWWLDDNEPDMGERSLQYRMK